MYQLLYFIIDLEKKTLANLCIGVSIVRFYRCKHVNFDSLGHFSADSKSATAYVAWINLFEGLKGPSSVLHQNRAPDQPQQQPNLLHPSGGGS